MQTSPRKARKPQQRSMPLRQAILDVAAQYERMSVRQLFYQLVTRKAIDKTEQAYKRVADTAVQMRLDGSLSYGKIADGSRSRRIGWQFGGLQEALDNTHELYRRNHWLDQPAYVEIWCEKDALTGVIEPVCREFGVPFVATRGFPSVTLLYESALSMKACGKPTFVYYFGDHDASGRTIHQNIEPTLRMHGADVILKRIALEPKQIEFFNLPTRPGKTTDSRHAKFAAQYGDASVELDALPPDVLTNLVRRCIRHHIDTYAWARSETVEQLERETLESIARLPLTAGSIYTLGGTTNEQ